MEKFINREKELDFLNEQYKRSASLAIIYGRRRVGKSELIKKFISDQNAYYFLADTTSRLDQIRSFIAGLGNYLDDEFLKTQQLTSWDAVFSYLSKLDKKVILVLDEFPYLIKEDKSIVSVMQKHWDLSLKNKKIMLILCGSSISTMENKVLGVKSPLYGRRTGDWFLKPLKFRDVSKFFPSLHAEEIAKIYGLFGGVPFYLKEWNEKIKFDVQLKNIIKKGSIFYNEPYFLVKEELSDPSNYFAVLKSIAAGECNLGKIASSSGVEMKSISKYLSVLENLHFIEREVPVTENNLRKRGLYKLSDHFLRFWFRFIFPNKNIIELNHEDLAVENIMHNYDDFMGSVFEDIAKEFLAEKFKSLEKIGRYWDGETEIDCIGISKSELIFAEFKWSRLSASELKKIYSQLLLKSKNIKTKNKIRKYVIISRKAEKKDFDDFQVFDFDDFM